MGEQPEALRLADAMTRALQQTDAEDDIIYVARWFVEDSRAELRRLHAVNAELLEALKEAALAIEYWGSYASKYFQEKHDLQGDINAARAAIAKAEAV